MSVEVQRYSNPWSDEDYMGMDRNGHWVLHSDYVELADKLEQQKEALKAAKALTDWCYGEVGADIDLTPGLRALCEYFGGYDVG